MFAAFTIARSGLAASMARFNAAAANIANAGVSGPLPATAPAGTDARDTAVSAYQPVEVVVRSLGGETPAGVAFNYRTRQPATIRQHDPSAPFADADGFIAAPNIDLAEEAVDILTALSAFRANAAVLRAADKMTEALLDIRA